MYFLRFRNELVFHRNVEHCYTAKVYALQTLLQGPRSDGPALRAAPSGPLPAQFIPEGAAQKQLN